MDSLDITVSLDTLSPSPNAAILRIVAVPWNRNAEESPFIADEPIFVGHVDLRSCIADGFEVSDETTAWWSRQPDEVKKEVFGPDAHPLSQVLQSFITWVGDIKKTYDTDCVRLWSLSCDSDIATLRNAFSRYGLCFPFDPGCFRDARTFLFEEGLMIISAADLNAADLGGELYKVYSRLSGTDRYMRREACADASRTTMVIWRMLRQARKRK